MGSIVCATRGGEGSRAVQLAAIQRAKESGRTLVFIYVLDPSILEPFEEPLHEYIHAEHLWMGKTLLRIAGRRASNLGVDAELVIRNGHFREEICDILVERRADLLMLGAPRLSSATLFDHSGIEQFADGVHESTGVPVEIVHPAPLPASLLPIDLHSASE